MIQSNRESGFGRYEIMLEPKKNELQPIIIEFKVNDKDEEGSLEETVSAALKQIKTKNYDAVLVEKGFNKKNIRHYGFAFEGKRVLIG